MIKYLDLKRINDCHDMELRQAIDEVLQSGWYLKGEATHRFEQHYADFIGTKFCIGCANGLDALTLIFRAYKEMGIMKDGDEVIVPANTFIASILAITDNNLVPVMVEPDIKTLEIDDRLIEQAITTRTRAIMIVHLYGRCAYTDKIGGGVSEPQVTVRIDQRLFVRTFSGPFFQPLADCPVRKRKFAVLPFETALYIRQNIGDPAGSVVSYLLDSFYHSRKVILAMQGNMSLRESCKASS